MVAVIPEIVAFRMAVPPVQTVVAPVTLTVGGLETTTIVESILVQFDVLVAVT